MDNRFILILQSILKFRSLCSNDLFDLLRAQAEALRFFSTSIVGRSKASNLEEELFDNLEREFKSKSMENQAVSDKICSELEARFVDSILSSRSHLTEATPVISPCNSCEGDLDGLQNMKLPSMHSFNFTFLRCKGHFDQGCVGPAKVWINVNLPCVALFHSPSRPKVPPYSRLHSLEDYKKLGNGASLSSSRIITTACTWDCSLSPSVWLSCLDFSSTSESLRVWDGQLLFSCSFILTFIWVCRFMKRDGGCSR